MAKKQLKVNTMYGADGRLRTSYFDGESAKVAKKNVKSFNKELSKYEKAYADYAELDIEDSKMSDINTRYVLGKLGVAEKYVDFVSEDELARRLGDETTAIAGNKHSQKLGVGAKIASKFQPFFEKQAQKHPSLQKLSDRVTKVANNGRMPLTADSAAMMRIAFDKKYYNDCRRPGADIDALCESHKKSIENLTKMAMFDGVERNELSAKFTEKLMNQMQVDESITDIYDGMANGSIRLADAKPVVNEDGKPIQVKGRTLFEQSAGFVSAAVNKNGEHETLDAWSFETREPQSIESILSDYQDKLDRYFSGCETEADIKRVVASDSYRNLERNAKTFAAADCPDDAAKFKYEFARYNLDSTKRWAIEHGGKQPFASLSVPVPWDERTEGNSFVKNYSVDDYYDINDRNDVHDKAVVDTALLSENELSENMAQECTAKADEMNDGDVLSERLTALEEQFKAQNEQMEALRAENEALKAELSAAQSSVEQNISSKIQPIMLDENKPEKLESVVEPSADSKKSIWEKASAVVNAANAVSMIDKIREHVQSAYANKPAILDVNVVDTEEKASEIQTATTLALESKEPDIAQTVHDEVNGIVEVESDEKEDADETDEDEESEEQDESVAEVESEEENQNDHDATPVSSRFQSLPEISSAGRFENQSEAQNEGFGS